MEDQDFREYDPIRLLRDCISGPVEQNEDRMSLEMYGPLGAAKQLSPTLHEHFLLSLPGDSM